MSVYSVSNKYLDPYDPFWICRLLALKTGTVALLLFLCNAFLVAPQSPMVYMMITLICTLASGVIPASTKAKKLVNFIMLLCMFSTTIIVFGLFSYFRFGLFLVIIAFTYLSLRVMAVNTKAAVIPTMMIMWGVMSVGGGATDFTAAANSYLYFFEFGLMGVITILLFPDFTPNVFKSAFVRILEADAENVGNGHFKNSDPRVLSALAVIHGKLPLLPDNYRTLYDAIIRFQSDFMRPHELNAEEQLLSKSALSELIIAVDNNVAFSLAAHNPEKIKKLNPAVFSLFSDLVEGYNQCLA
jgi:hypothetical protein